MSKESLQLSWKEMIKSIFGRAIVVYIGLVLVFRWSVDFTQVAQERSHYLLGIFYNGFYKNYSDGIVYFEHLLRVEPRKTINLANIGECYYQLGQYEKARGYFQKALELEPKNAQFELQLDKAIKGSQ